MYPFSGPQSPVPCPPLKELTLKVCVPWSPMCSMSCLLPLLVPAVPGPLSPVPGPLPPLKNVTLKVCIQWSRMYSMSCLTSTCSPPSPIPRPLSPVPPPKKKWPERCVSNGVQCVRCRVSYLYLFPLYPVPGPLSPAPCPPKKLTLKVCIQWS